jgi:MFS transporter, DHA2 family, multidrug resistance protein
MLGSLGTAIYRSRMTGAPVPGLTADNLQAAQSTLGGALAAARTLPVDQAAPFLFHARDAFMVGFHMVAALSVIAMLFCAVVALLVLKDVKPAGH